VDNPYPHLFRPLELGRLTLRNRITMSTHNRDMGTRRYARYLEARARGGVASVGVQASVGLIDAATTPGTFLEAYATERDAFLPSSDRGDVAAYLQAREVPRLRQLADAVQPHGAAIIGQLHHGGADRVTGAGVQPLVAPSVLVDEFTHEVPHELSTAEIHEIVRNFGHAAHRAKLAGLDALEINACHFYLINEFLSTYVNRRTDMYGGSLKNRMRLLHEVLEEVRGRAGELPIGIRLNGEEYVRGGLTNADMIEISRLIQNDVQYISITAGTFSGVKAQNTIAYVNPWLDVSGQMPQIKQAAAIKAAISTPVIVVGRITDPGQAEEYISKGFVDAVGMTRALIADPEFALKAGNGTATKIRRCIGTNECHLLGRPIACAVNAAAGREEELEPREASASRRIAVIGGGPGGMEAARTAASRGHVVTLFERSAELGGMLRLVARLPQNERLAQHLAHMTAEIIDAGVDVRLSVEAGVTDVFDFDVVIAATGGVPFIPDIAGVDAERVYTAPHVLATQADLGSSVLVVGGLEDHLAPFLAAELAAEQSRNVTIATELPTLGPALEAAVWNASMRRLLERHIEVMNLTRAVAISGTSVTLNNILSGDATVRAFDSVILACGSRADSKVAAMIDEAGQEVHLIGDCRAPRRMMHAIAEGARLAATL
jgi:2,4-dienoyl-CoA reductase-like NADH-dependent reductase (Old Yellow Enzyme family)/thioredoxin reductase